MAGAESGVLGLFNPTDASITLLPITSHRLDTPLFRIPIRLCKNGLKQDSQIMVDKITAVHRDRIRERIGRINPALLQKTEEALLRFIGFEAQQSETSNSPGPKLNTFPFGAGRIAKTVPTPTDCRHLEPRHFCPDE